MTGQGVDVNTLPCHKDSYFEAWSTGDTGWTDGGQRRALRRLKFWLSKSDKKPTLNDMLAAINATENAALAAEAEAALPEGGNRRDGA